MRESGRDFADVLAEAQKLGYAEADPSFDIDGIDAAHKLAILTASRSAPRSISPGSMSRASATSRALDIDFAEELGYRIKLLGIARPTEDGLEQRVHPCMVPRATPIAAVEGVFNAVVVEGDFVGRVVLEGRGAGRRARPPRRWSPISSTSPPAATSPASGSRPPSCARCPGAPMERHRGAYYIRLMVVDRPGVIADVAAALARRAGLDGIDDPARPRAGRGGAGGADDP